MCAAAISFARIRRLHFGAYDPKGGGVEHGPRFFAQSTCHHRPEVVGGLQTSRAEVSTQNIFRAAPVATTHKRHFTFAAAGS